MDCEAEALAFCRKMPAKNGQKSLFFVLMDWRKPAIGRGAFDFIWGRRLYRGSQIYRASR